MRKTRVVITGVGAITPLGSDFKAIADNLLAGKSAARRVVDSQGGAELRVPGCLADEPPAPAGWEETDFRAQGRQDRFLLWCLSNALADAGYDPGDRGLRMGLALGNGGEMLHRWEADWRGGGDEVFRGEQDIATVAASLARRFGWTGPVATIAAACASANYAFAQARRWLEVGLADVCLAGAVECISPICRGAFYNLRALSRQADEPTKASRPFDARRDGFVMGEGAVLMVLESAERAERRGARIYGEVAGFGAASDAAHMIIPSSNPAPAAAAIQGALADAGVGPSEIDYINAHATSTPEGDKCEARAIRAVFGEATDSVPVSSTKSMTGHLLSAAAAMEALACLVALERQWIPPTINLEEPDPECPLCHVPQRAIERPVRVALSNSFGFGGSNTSLILRQYAA
jgi:3-oxoacyl-[acyl-carrier-protein] synthase II